MVKNLSQFKKALATGRQFEIIEHYLKPQHTGEIRKANVMQTNGMYSIVTNGINEEIANTVNGGKGMWLDFGKASQWVFDGEYITYKLITDQLVWKIRMV